MSFRSTLAAANDIIGRGWITPAGAARLLADTPSRRRVIEAIPAVPYPCTGGVLVYRLKDSNGGPYRLARGPWPGEEINPESNLPLREIAFRHGSEVVVHYLDGLHLIAGWLSDEAIAEARAWVDPYAR